MKAIERSRLALPVAGLQICTSKGEMYVSAWVTVRGAQLLTVWWRCVLDPHAF